MLHTSAVNEGTLALLKELMRVKELSNFSLVGGTAPALRFGHRISEDIDLFTEHDFEKEDIDKALRKKFRNRYFYEERGNPLGIFCFIDDIKIDLIKYQFPLISELHTEDVIRIYSNEDIMAMKIATILKRAKKKDFWDIAELLKYYSVDDFVRYFFKKFPEQILLISIPQMMIYFEAAESDKNPKSLKAQKWRDIKRIISKSVREYLK